MSVNGSSGSKSVKIAFVAGMKTFNPADYTMTEPIKQVEHASIGSN